MATIDAWINALLGRIWHRGTPVDLEGALNFMAPLSATRNTGTSSIDIGLDGNPVFAAGETGDGNYRLRVAPDASAVVATLANGANLDYTIELTENGYMSIAVSVLVLVDGNYLRAAIRFDAQRVAGVLTLVGDTVIVREAVGVTLTPDVDAGDLMVNIANTTGDPLSGRMHVGWSIQDLLA